MLKISINILFASFEIGLGVKFTVNEFHLEYSQVKLHVQLLTKIIDLSKKI
jgi:hypothetical protein